MSNYQPVDDHWQSRMEAIEGRTVAEPPDAEPDACRFCGKGLYQEEADLGHAACRACIKREGLHA